MRAATWGRPRPCWTPCPPGSERSLINRTDHVNRRQCFTPTRGATARARHAGQSHTMSCGALDELLSQHVSPVMVVVVGGDGVELISALAGTECIVRHQSLEPGRCRIEVQGPDLDTLRRQLPQLVSQAKLALHSMEEMRADLESAFLAVVEDR